MPASAGREDYKQGPLVEGRKLSMLIVVQTTRLLSAAEHTDLLCFCHSSVEQGRGLELCRQEGCGHMGVGAGAGVGVTCSWGVAQKAARQADELLHKALLRICWITQLICSTLQHAAPPALPFIHKDVLGEPKKPPASASV